MLWGLVNLLPIYPLDGGNIGRQVFVLINPRDAMRRSLVLSVLVGGAMTAITLVQAVRGLNEAMQAIGVERPDLFELMSFFFLPALFGYLTFSNYEALRSQQVRGGW